MAELKGWRHHLAASLPAYGAFRRVLFEIAIDTRAVGLEIYQPVNKVTESIIQPTFLLLREIKALIDQRHAAVKLFARDFICSILFKALHYFPHAYDFSVVVIDLLFDLKHTLLGSQAAMLYFGRDR